MKKLKLYLDCDGVILDTISKSYEIIKQMGIDTEEETRKFYSNLDWDNLIKVSGQINNAILKIEILKEYFNVSILTHVNSKRETESKIKYFKEVLPDVEVITVPKYNEKADVIDPKGAILVDDYTPNLEKWADKGGIAIKFSDSGKKCDFITITDLLELLTINFNKEKV